MVGSVGILNVLVINIFDIHFENILKNFVPSRAYLLNGSSDCLLHTWIECSNGDIWTEPPEICNCLIVNNWSFWIMPPLPTAYCLQPGTFTTLKVCLVPKTHAQVSLGAILEWCFLCASLVLVLCRWLKNRWFFLGNFGVM